MRLIDMTFLNSLDRKVSFDLLVLSGGSGDAPLLGKLAWAAKRVFCADGGAQDLYKWAPSIRPELICGDLDSISGTQAETHYRNIGIPIIKIFDQDRNDFEKSLALWLERVGGDSDVVVWCNFNGTRIDHEFSNYNTLYNNMDNFPSVILISQCSAVAVIPSGETMIRIAKCMLTSKSAENYSGLIPLFGPVCTIHTEGFKWNCGPDYPKLNFGGIVSSSNQVTENKVFIKTSDPVLFTTTIDCHYDALSDSEPQSKNSDSEWCNLL